jgi:putative FmdB family regulatory protein
MPIYEYLCRGCGHRFDKLVRLSDTPDCPVCKSVELERQFTPTAGISTQKTRKRSMGVARASATARKKEKDHAQREYEANVIKDHS